MLFQVTFYKTNQSVVAAAALVVVVVIVVVVCSYVYTLCPKKTCEYIFYNNFNNKCPITIIFGIDTSKSMCHRTMIVLIRLDDA